MLTFRLVAVGMGTSKEVSMQMKEAEPNITILKINGLVHSLKRREGELSDTERPAGPWRTTRVDDGRILSLLKKKTFTKSCKVKDCLKGVSVSVSKSTIKRRPHLKKDTASPAQFGNTTLRTDETKMSLFHNDGKRRL